MTPDEHNKYVGFANLAYGVIHVLMIGVAGLFVLGMTGAIARNPGSDGPSPTVFLLVLFGALGLNLLMSIPSFVAGYGFLKRKRWARTLGITAAVMSAVRIPFGTVVSIYTLWFLLTAPGRVLYDNLSQALPPAPPVDWREAEESQRETEYASRTSPPDWR